MMESGSGASIWCKKPQLFLNGCEYIDISKIDNLSSLLDDRSPSIDDSWLHMPLIQSSDTVVRKKRTTRPHSIIGYPSSITNKKVSTPLLIGDSTAGKPPLNLQKQHGGNLEGRRESNESGTSSKMQLGYRDLHTAQEQEVIKQHILSTFQLAKLITEFVTKFSGVYEKFAHELGELANTYKQKTSEYSKDLEGTPYEQSSLKLTWDTLLQEVLSDTENYVEFASKANKIGHSRLLEVVACKKLDMKEMFNFRHNMDTMVDSSEETLHKSFDTHRQHFSVNSHDRKDKAFVHCVQAHNDYILELKGTNRLIDEYHNSGLPWVLDELESVHKDTCHAVNSALQNLALLSVSKARDQAHRYDGVFSVCKQVSISNDIQTFVKNIRPKIGESTEDDSGSPRHHVFKPVLDHPSTPQCLMRGEIIFEKIVESSIRSRKQMLGREAAELARAIEEKEQALLSLQNAQQRLISANNFNKVYDVHSDLCRQKKDLQMAKLRHSVVQCQMNALMPAKSEQTIASEGGESALTKPSSKNTSIKAMWKKFAKKASHKKRDGNEDENQNIHKMNGSNTNVASDVGVGTMLSTEELQREKDGPADPVYNLLKSASSLSKKPGAGDGDSSGVSSMRSLPRQNTASSGKSGSSRSSSPGIFIKQGSKEAADECLAAIDRELNIVDQSITMKQQSSPPTAAKRKSRTSPIPAPRRERAASLSRVNFSINPTEALTSRKAASPSMRRRSCTPIVLRTSDVPANRSVTATRPKQMLNKRMKSFSLDTPDAPKQMDASTKAKSNSYTNNISIPGSNLSPSHARRRLQMAGQHRGLSIDLDEQPFMMYNNSSNSLHSNQSNSPRHSHHHINSSSASQSVQEYQGSSLGDVYVAVYDFTAKEQGDLSLRAGDRIQVKDTTDPDWWIGTVEGYTGYFPHRYVLPLAAGQRVYQIVKPLHLGNGNSEIKLLRDQVVIENGHDEHGMVNIQTNDIKTGKIYHLACPIRYLHEI